MKKIFSILVFAFSISGFAKELPRFVDEEKSWIFSYLPFETFKELPKSAQKEYIQLARTFLVQQEMRKEKDFAAAFSETAASRFVLFNFLMNSADAANSALTFPDANGRCNYADESSKKLSKSLQDIVRKGRDQCVVAGRTVCMALITDPANEEAQKVVCKLENMPEVLKALKKECNEKSLQLLACGGLFSSKDGTRPCVEAKAGSTKACNASAPSVEETIAYLNSSLEAQKEYQIEFEQIRKYCGKQDRINSFDVKDCEILNERLRKLEEAIPDVNKTIPVADCTLKAGSESPPLKSDLRFQFRQKGSKKYQVETSGAELKNWYVQDGAGGWNKPDGSSISNSSKSLFLSRAHGDQLFLENVFPNYSQNLKDDCKEAIVLSHKYFGKMKDKACVVNYINKSGEKVETKITGVSTAGDERFSEQSFEWNPQEIPKFPDLKNSPEGKNVDYIRTKSEGKDNCSITLHWEMDATPTPKKSTGGRSVDPKGEKQKR